MVSGQRTVCKPGGAFVNGMGDLFLPLLRLRTPTAFWMAIYNAPRTGGALENGPQVVALTMCFYASSALHCTVSVP